MKKKTIILALVSSVLIGSAALATTYTLNQKKNYPTSGCSSTHTAASCCGKKAIH